MRRAKLLGGGKTLFVGLLSGISTHSDVFPDNSSDERYLASESEPHHIWTFSTISNHWWWTGVYALKKTTLRECRLAVTHPNILRFGFADLTLVFPAKCPKELL